MKKQNGFTLIELLVVLAIVAILAIVIFSFVGGHVHFKTDPDNAYRVLSLNNYKNIEVTGYRFFGCGHNDWYHTGFRATAPNGQTVTGVVCRGYWSWGKPNTIRID